jgi:heme-degrading monooxygenase HmoA
MHARVGQFHFIPDHFSEAIRLIREEITPEMRRQAGFKSVLVVTDEKKSKTVSISIWESEEAMRAGERTGGYFQDALMKLAPLFIGSPVIEHYDVGA